MKSRRINGTQLEKMLYNGVANLRLHEQEVNDLNVFPVPDGDTGTNMLLTLGNGIKNISSNEECGEYLKELSQSIVLSARGNSGILLSQIFCGFAKEVSRYPLLGPGELRDALVAGYRNAYENTIQPIEGTILTVCREGIEHIKPMITRRSCAEDILAMYIAEMRKTLSFTTDMLPALRDANVVDSGALGYIYIFEGMLKYLYGDIIQINDEDFLKHKNKIVGIESFNEDSEFEYGYCMEFVLQLMNGEKYLRKFNVNTYTEDLGYYGNSLAVVKNGTRVKVHIHTFDPAKVIKESQEYGEFISFKLDNMQVQHNEFKEQKNNEHCALAMIAVSYGDGMSSVFRQLGCNYVIERNDIASVSSEELLMLCKQCNADVVAIFPNDKNIIRAAEQAAKINQDNNFKIIVIPTTTPTEGYFALAMDIKNSDDVDKRIEQMKQGMNNVKTIYQTKASKDYSNENITCKVGEEIAIVEDVLRCKGTSSSEAVLNALSSMDEIEDYDVMLIFKGEDVSNEEGENLVELIASKYPLIEPTVVDGGQDIYNWIIGIS